MLTNLKKKRIFLLYIDPHVRFNFKQWCLYWTVIGCILLASNFLICLLRHLNCGTLSPYLLIFIHTPTDNFSLTFQSFLTCNTMQEIEYSGLYTIVLVVSRRKALHFFWTLVKVSSYLKVIFNIMQMKVMQCWIQIQCFLGMGHNSHEKSRMKAVKRTLHRGTELKTTWRGWSECGCTRIVPWLAWIWMQHGPRCTQDVKSPVHAF